LDRSLGKTAAPDTEEIAASGSGEPQDDPQDKPQNEPEGHFWNAHAPRSAAR
jgi:hypothetical protein